LALRADDYLTALRRELDLVRDGPAHRVLSAIGAILDDADDLRGHVRRAAERALESDTGCFVVALRLEAPDARRIDELLLLLDEAAAEARRGRLLTLPPPDDVQQFLSGWLRAVRAHLFADAPPDQAWTWTENDHEWHPLEVPRPSTSQGFVAEASPTATARLAPHPSASGQARQLLRRVEDRWGHPELFEAAELPLSELVANAVLHARTQIEVAVCLVDEGLRVEVHDERPELHPAASHDRESTTGRGLELVGAIADRWGVIRQPAGKTVWFELDRAAEVSAAG
jgi:anti-sigma regulatory factor (Ser/Thr protein kinase)